MTFSSARHVALAATCLALLAAPLAAQHRAQTISGRVTTDSGVVEEIRKQEPRLRAQADSIHTELANYLVALPAEYDSRAAGDRVRAAFESVWGVVYAEKPLIATILTPGQVRLLSTAMRDMLTIPG